ncbi:QUAI protein, partial [Acromyrmex insinuator]
MVQECVEDTIVYLYTHPADRNRNTIISVIKQGEFQATHNQFEKIFSRSMTDYKLFEIFCTLLEDTDQSARMQMTSKVTTDFDNYIKYSSTMLKSEPDNLPASVDVRRKEMHLTYDNFIAIFKMEPAVFEKLPTWKRQCQTSCWTLLMMFF